MGWILTTHFFLFPCCKHPNDEIFPLAISFFNYLLKQVDDFFINLSPIMTLDILFVVGS
jgi:hypothetical protein